MIMSLFPLKLYADDIFLVSNRTLLYYDWPSKNVLICQQDTADHILSGFKKKGWIAYRIYEVDMEEISEVLK